MASPWLQKDDVSPLPVAPPVSVEQGNASSPGASVAVADAPAPAVQAGPSAIGESGPQVRVVTARLLERLLFETKLKQTLIKVATFIAYLICFFCVLQSILPSDEASTARRQLEATM